MYSEVDREPSKGRMRVVVLGSGGLLGSAVMKTLSIADDYQVIGLSRTDISQVRPVFLKNAELHYGIDVRNTAELGEFLCSFKPEVVINCVGVVKQKGEAVGNVDAITINAVFPHQLSELCGPLGCRVIHISTDCVFSGAEGSYKESDAANATDVYGLSKRLGEIDAPNITLRTSVIGREIKDHVGLLDWFLSQNNDVLGYSRAIFSGLPSPEIAKVLRDFVLPNKTLVGLYHLAANPISKYDLLKLIASEYGLTTHIVKDSDFKIDRSLNAQKFNSETGYTPPTWQALVRQMHEFGEAYA